MKVKEYKVVKDETYHYTSGYYTQNKWTTEGNLVLARSVDKDMESKRIFKSLLYGKITSC